MKHFQLYRFCKQDDPVFSYDRDLSVLRIGRYWLLNFNTYDSRVVRSVGFTFNFGLSWPMGDLLTLNLYLYRKNFSFSLIQRDYDRFWDEDIDWGGPCEKPKNEGA